MIGIHVLAEFDLSSISDNAVRTEYRHLLARAHNVGESLCRHFGRDRPLIRARYVDDQQFNASADEMDGTYLAEISASVPLFLLILFGRLLSDPTILPSLDASGQLASDYSLPAVIDLNDFSRRAEWQIALNPLRSFAAGTIADICSTFVVCHEMGHIVNGHVEGARAFDGKPRLAELVSVVPQVRGSLDRRQAWEADADALACQLLTDFLDELWKDGDVNPRTAAVFGRGREGLAQIVSLAIASLFAFFCYLQGTRDRLHLKSTHPPPLVRAYCARDYLMAAALRRWDEFDIDLADRLLDERLDEFMIVLERLGIFNPRDFTASRVRQVERQVARVKELQIVHRPACAQWCWIEWGAA